MKIGEAYAAVNIWPSMYGAQSEQQWWSKQWRESAKRIFYLRLRMHHERSTNEERG